MPISQRKNQKEIETEGTAKEKQLNKEVVEQILLEARIVARWAKKPFYIS
ncbi:MAG: hypothetical protein QG670_2399 [Thermoproteota archaeon]|nr:hypothetical protein [Thermoproteota archaeon]